MEEKSESVVTASVRHSSCSEFNLMMSECLLAL